MEQQQARDEIHALAVPHHRIVQRVRAQHTPERGDAVVRGEHGQARKSAAHVLLTPTHRGTCQAGERMSRRPDCTPSRGEEGGDKIEAKHTSA